MKKKIAIKQFKIIKEILINEYPNMSVDPNDVENRIGFIVSKTDQQKDNIDQLALTLNQQITAVTETLNTINGKTDNILSESAIREIIALFISDNNRYPTLESVKSAMPLQYTPDDVTIKNEDDVVAVITHYLEQHTDIRMTPEEIKNIIRIYNENNNVNPTLDEVKTALSLDTITKLTIEQQSKDEIEQMIAQYNLDNPVDTLTPTEVEAIIGNYVENNNVNPTLQDVIDNLNLNTINASTTADVQQMIEDYYNAHPDVDRTDEQVIELVRTWVEANVDTSTIDDNEMTAWMDTYLLNHPELRRTDAEVEALIQNFIEVNNTNPTEEEVYQALNLTENYNAPYINFLVKPAVMRPDNIIDLITRKISVINTSLPYPPSKDIKYIVNRTQPLVVSVWLDDSTLSVPNNAIHYNTHLESLFVMDGTDIKKYDLDNNLIKTYNIGYDKVSITIDGLRLAAVDNATLYVYEYDSTNDDYILMNSVDIPNIVDMITMNRIGNTIVVGRKDTGTIHTYKLDTVDGVFKHLSTMETSNSFKHIELNFDGDALYTSQTDILSLYNFADTNWAYLNDFIFKKREVDNTLSDSTISISDSFHISVDENRFFIGSPDEKRVVSFMIVNDNIYEEERIFNSDDLNFGKSIASSYDLRYVYISSDNEIKKYRANNN